MRVAPSGQVYASGCDRAEECRIVALDAKGTVVRTWDSARPPDHPGSKVPTGMDEASEDVEPRVARPHLFPQVARPMAGRVRGVALPSRIATVEGQELRRESLEPRRHFDEVRVHGEVDERTPPERHVGRISVLQALLDRVEVLGASQLWLYPSTEAEARGLAAAFNGELRVEVRESGRGERSRAEPLRVNVRIVARGLARGGCWAAAG
ncbi:MAG: hypothetical protein ACLQHS_00710 [Candidatus Limnocylindrales bacterium]